MTLEHKRMRIPGVMCSNDSPYARPSDWLSLPTVSEGEEKFVGLHAVFNCSSNFVSIRAEGAFTVDWGDGGPTEDFSSNAIASRKLAYANYSDLTSRGYRQAIITVTPQAGQSLTKVDLCSESDERVSHSTTGWLDIRIAGVNISTLVFYSGSIIENNMLEQFEYVGSNSLTSCGELFRNCRALQNIVNFDTSSSTDFSYMFCGCSSLVHAPMLDTSSATSFSHMLEDCYSLVSVTAYNSSFVSTFSSMFNNCYSLKNVAAFDTLAGTNFVYMFNGCCVLESVPLFDISSATAFNAIFNNCYSLKEVPTFDTSSCTNLSYLFYNCFSLQKVPPLDTSSCTNFSYMFYRCTALTVAPTLDTSLGADFSYMFYRCSSLTIVPLLDTSSAISFASIFGDCQELSYVPALDVSSVTNFGGVFYRCYSLRSAALSGTAYDISYSGCLLSATDLNAIFTNLATVGSGTITITGCYGVGDVGYDATIATAKGWTVTA